jgi:hypothetical protein
MGAAAATPAEAATELDELPGRLAARAAGG